MIGMILPLAPVMTDSDGIGLRCGKRDMRRGHRRLIDAPVSHMKMHSWSMILRINTGDLNFEYGIGIGLFRVLSSLVASPYRVFFC